MGKVELRLASKKILRRLRLGRREVVEGHVF